MPSQHTHTSTPFSSKKFPIVVLCDAVQSPANVGGLLRVCDAFGVSEVIFCNSAIDFSSKRMKKTARSAEGTVKYSISDDIDSEIDRFKLAGYQIVALEIASLSIPIQNLAINKDQKYVLLLGNERHGVSKDILQQADTIVHIEMFGFNSSMNVVQAASIALFNITKS